MGSAHPSRRLLLLEDDRDLADSLELLLKTVGFSMRCETTAAGARSAFDDCFPDVLVTDIRLVGEDGLSLLRWAREQARQAKRALYTIVMSGHPDYRSGEAAIEAGANRYFPKPVEPAELLTEIVKATEAPVGPNLTRAFADGTRLVSIVHHSR
jgi:DNA-binding response OmpR family regulator